jgi:hypothetical protein
LPAWLPDQAAPVLQWLPVWGLAGTAANAVGVHPGIAIIALLKNYFQNTCNPSKLVIQTWHFDGFADAGCSVHQKQRSLSLKTLQAYVKHLKDRAILRACKISAGGVADLRQTNQQLTWLRIPQ